MTVFYAVYLANNHPRLPDFFYFGLSFCNPKTLHLDLAHYYFLCPSNHLEL